MRRAWCWRSTAAGAWAGWKCSGAARRMSPRTSSTPTGRRLGALAGTLASLGRPICLHRVPADSPTIAALQESYRRRGLVLCRTVSGCPSIPIDASWQEPERKFDGKRRYTFRRRLRLAEAVAPVSFEVLSPSPVEVEPLLDEAYRVEAAGWKGELGTA